MQLTRLLAILFLAILSVVALPVANPDPAPAPVAYPEPANGCGSGRYYDRSRGRCRNLYNYGNTHSLCGAGMYWSNSRQACRATWRNRSCQLGWRWSNNRATCVSVNNNWNGNW